MIYSIWAVQCDCRFYIGFTLANMERIDENNRIDAYGKIDWKLTNHALESIFSYCWIIIIIIFSSLIFRSLVCVFHSLNINIAGEKKTSASRHLSWMISQEALRTELPNNNRMSQVMVKEKKIYILTHTQRHRQTDRSIQNSRETFHK